MGSTGPRALAIGALKHAWGWDVRKIEEAFKDEHAPSGDVAARSVTAFCWRRIRPRLRMCAATIRSGSRPT